MDNVFLSLISILSVHSLHHVFSILPVSPSTFAPLFLRPSFSHCTGNLTFFNPALNSSSSSSINDSLPLASSIKKRLIWKNKQAKKRKKKSLLSLMFKLFRKINEQSSQAHRHRQTDTRTHVHTQWYYYVVASLLYVYNKLSKAVFIIEPRSFFLSSVVP